MKEMHPVSETYNIDCMEYMRTIPDKFFDLAVVDPPYFSGPEKRGFYGCRESKIGVQRLYKKSAQWNVPGKEYFDELLRVSDKYIVWGCNYYGYIFDHGRIVWNKCNGSSSFSDCEIAATNLFKSVRMFSYMWNGMMQGKSISEGHIMQGDKTKNEKRIHPTQKPVALYSYIFKTFSSVGQKIFDSHLGSGSSRIAAYKMGLDFYGCEIDAEYFNLSQERFERECLGIERLGNKIITQQSLF